MPIKNEKNKVDKNCKHLRTEIQDEHFYQFKICLDCNWFDKKDAPCWMGGHQHYYKNGECVCGNRKYG